MDGIGSEEIIFGTPGRYNGKISISDANDSKRSGTLFLLFIDMPQGNEFISIRGLIKISEPQFVFKERIAVGKQQVALTRAYPFAGHRLGSGDHREAEGKYRTGNSHFIRYCLLLKRK